MRRIWLGFAQAATIVFAVLYLVSFFRPEPPPPRGEVVTVKEAAPTGSGAVGAASYSGAAKKAMPAVVNIYTAKQIARPRLSRDEQMLRRFFGVPSDEGPEAATSLGSGVIVSATGRSRLGISTFENFIQTDAAINPGNSGGALVDINGNLVGINTAIFTKTEGSVGIGFAIPVSLARQVMDQIIKQGRVERGWIGVQAQDIPPEAAESGKRGPVKGALVAGVVRGTPADKAGLKRGDIVVAINGKPIADVTDLINLTAALKPGERGEFAVLREGREVKLAVDVGTRPRQPKS